MWRVPRLVFQACALSQNSTKYRADDLCVNLVRSVSPTFVSADYFLFIILTNKKNLYMGSFNYFSYAIQIELNWYMADTDVRHLHCRSCNVFLILPDLMTYVAKIYQIGLHVYNTGK